MKNELENHRKAGTRLQHSAGFFASIIHVKLVKMKKVVILVVTVLLTVMACKKEKDDVPQANNLLRHVVLFKFKDGTTTQDVKKVEDAFRALPAQIKEIQDFEWGTNNSPENLNQGFTHCFLVTFLSEEGRAIYLPHPAHQAFVDVLSPHLDKVLVIDYWAQK